MSEDRHIEGPKLRCDCAGRCTVLAVDFDKYGEGERLWSWDFYTNSGYDGSWRHRLRIIWNLLRGKDHYFHGTVHTAEDMRRLRDFLNATLLDRTQSFTVASTTTSGTPIIYRLGKAT